MFFIILFYSYLYIYICICILIHYSSPPFLCVWNILVFIIHIGRRWIHLPLSSSVSIFHHRHLLLLLLVVYLVVRLVVSIAADDDNDAMMMIDSDDDDTIFVVRGIPVCTYERTVHTFIPYIALNSLIKRPRSLKREIYGSPHIPF